MGTIRAMPGCLLAVLRSYMRQSKIRVPKGQGHNYSGPVVSVTFGAITGGGAPCSSVPVR